MNAAEFNALYEVGVPVFAYPGARPEDFPKATRLVTRTRSKASVLGGHTDVVWVDGHSACIALSHVDVVSESAFEEALLADTVKREGALPVPVGPEPQTPESPTLTGYRRAYADAVATVARQAQKIAELERIANAERARVAELLAERHTTNEALSDAAERMRADRDRIAELEKDSRTLAALHAAGVDNWEGYDQAVEGVA